MATHATHPYTCNTCQVAFRSSDQQRTHMQSDWHRYNLQRRVAALPPLTAEIFNEKVLATQATAAATAARAAFERVCGACQRTYYSENAYTNHLSSRKHRERLAQLETADTETTSLASAAFSLGESAELASVGSAGTAGARGAKGVDGVIEDLKRAKLGAAAADDDDETDDSDDASTTAGDDSARIPVTCLFCNRASDSLAANVQHMQTAHGMFVPEQRYLVDLAGLVAYLHEQIYELHECLYCGATKYTTPGIQTHMRDKGHCMIAFESEAQMIEIGQFYDFSSTYDDDDDDDESDESDDAGARPARGGGVKLGGARATHVDAAADDDEDWSDEESDSDEAMPDAAPKHKKPKAAAAQPYVDDYELHLPSGRAVGHRSLARYFRQNLRNYPTPEERAAARLAITDDTRPVSDDEDTANGEGPRGRRGRQQALVSRANGGLGMLGASEATKREARAVEQRETHKAQRRENAFRARVERKGNNQKHFRDPLLQ